MSGKRTQAVTTARFYAARKAADHLGFSGSGMRIETDPAARSSVFRSNWAAPPLIKWRFKMRFAVAAATAALMLACAGGAYAGGASLTPMGQTMNPMVGGQAMMM